MDAAKKTGTLELDTSKIARYVWLGRNDLNWYKDCQTTFEKLFGEHRLELVCKLFAATSINTALKANVTLFLKALHEIENDLPTGNYLPNIYNQIERIRNGEELSGRKISSFARAMAGDVDAVVVDIWLLRAFGLDRKYYRHTGVRKGTLRSGGASSKQYDVIEQYCREEAKHMKIEARQFSSMLWAGVRIFTNGDKETHYKRMLLYKMNTLFNNVKL